MCGGGGYSPPPPVVRQPAQQAAVAPSGGIKKKNTKQQTPTAGFNAKPTMLSGTAGIGDDALNLGGKTILGG